MDDFTHDSHDGFLAFDQTYDPHEQRYTYLTSNASTWPLPLEHNMSQADNQHNNANGAADTSSSRANTTTGSLSARPMTSTAPPLRTNGLIYPQAIDPANTLLTSPWQYQNSQHFQQQYSLQDNGLDGSYTGTYGMQLQTSPVDFAPTAAQMNTCTSLALDPAYLQAFTTSIDTMTVMAPFHMHDFHEQLMSYPINQHGMPTTTSPDYVPASLPNSSPAESWLALDQRSLSGRSDNGSTNDWTLINIPGSRQSLDGYSDVSGNIVISPQALHIRTDSNSSHNSEGVPLSASSYEEIQYPFHSPEPDLPLEYAQTGAPNGYPLIPVHQYHTRPATEPIAIAPSNASASASPTSSGTNSPVLSRRRKSPVSPTTGVTSKVIAKAKTKATTTVVKKDGAVEKKVGRRKGPLRPDQRQQAHEIRKLRACLRCKFLKKVCDKGSPCGGCQPSHQRLWQVPCTRIDIKDIGYFLKDWKADYERHVSLGFSVGNIKGFSQVERTIYITHGYGFFFPLTAREVFVRDEKCFGVDWVESLHETPQAYEVVTAKLTAGVNGVSQEVLSDYLDNYIDNGFEMFVDSHFEGTPFMTEMLKTVYRYWTKTQLPVIRKALKLVLAYNLTLHITMVQGLSEEELKLGSIGSDSRFKGETCAPVMINFQVKCALAETWRNLMKEILEELSSLYSSVYSGEKLKNWPTIFMLAVILLLVWEEMQFDCHYRVPDQDAVRKFCAEMEGTPVGVVVGLFQAMSTKLPTFMEWDSRKHHHVWNSNTAICDAMTEVRSHVTKHETYLKARHEAKFDREDFDCLSNKFLSKLVIRPTASAH